MIKIRHFAQDQSVPILCTKSDTLYKTQVFQSDWNTWLLNSAILKHNRMGYGNCAQIIAMWSPDFLWLAAFAFELPSGLQPPLTIPDSSHLEERSTRVEGYGESVSILPHLIYCMELHLWRNGCSLFSKNLRSNPLANVFGFFRMKIDPYFPMVLRVEHRKLVDWEVPFIILVPFCWPQCSTLGHLVYLTLLCLPANQLIDWWIFWHG